MFSVFTQIMMFSLKKVDNLRAREREREEKGTTNSEGKWSQYAQAKKKKV